MHGHTNLVDLQDVSRVYGRAPNIVRALDSVSLTIAAGEFVVVLGPSGSGKTTILNIIGALDVASSGRVVVAGRDITRANRSEQFGIRRSTVSFVFQSFNLFPGLTAEENVAFGLDAAGRRGKASPRAILEQVGLGDRVHRFPNELSGGEQQRVAIARALATGNPILLADEPTGELDFQTGVRILELLQTQTAAGHAVVVVTHNREISRAADRVVELSGGRIVSDGPPSGGPVPIDRLYW